MSKLIPIEFYEQTAREEGWLPIGECRVEDLRGLDEDVVTSAVFHDEPPFFNIESCEFASAESWKALAEQQKIRIFGRAYRIPHDLAEDAARLAREFRVFVADHHGRKHMLNEDCTAFRSPAHQGRHENVEVSGTAAFALIYDGGPIAPIMNLSYEDYKAYDAAFDFFDKRGFWFEHYTHWWSWIYRK